MAEQGNDDHGQLRQVLRVRDGVAVLVGIVIGAGILRTPGLIAGYVGSPTLILLLWMAGGLVAGLSMITLAEMAAALPRAGGKYIYAHAAFGPIAGFVAGWSEVLVGRTFSGAIKALVIAEYLVILTRSGTAVELIASLVIVAYVLLHVRGIRAGTLFQNVTTVMKIVVLLGISAAGMAALGPREVTVATSPEGGVLLGMALAYQSVTFAHAGWEDAAKLAEETRDPGKNLPRILMIGVATVVGLYLLVNVAFLSALTPAQMAGSELVARDAVASMFGDAAGTIVTLAGLVILASSLNVNFFALPRVALAMARDGLAPGGLQRVSARGTPVPALMLVSLLIFGLAVSGALELLIRFMATITICVDLLVMLAFFGLRRRQPDLVRPFRVPGHPWVPALAVILNALVLAVIVWTQPDLALGGGAMLVVLVIVATLVSRRRKGRDHAG